MPGLSELKSYGAPVTEIDAVAVAPHETGGTRRAPAVRAVPPPTGFREVSRHSGRTFTVVRDRADAPVPIVPSNLPSLALERGTPDYVLQAPAP